MVTGSLAAGSDVLAAHLAALPGARLAVVVDPAVPDRAEWDGYLASASVHDVAAAGVRAILAAEAGGRIHVLRAAAGDAAALRTALEEAREAFGALHGVVHAPPVDPSTELAALAEGRTAEAAAASLGRAARELAALEEATEGLALDWVILNGSTASVLGAAGWLALAARLALADAWAQRRAGRDGTRWVSVAWDQWHHGDDDAAADGAGAIPRSQGARLWERVAALAAQPRVVVSLEPPANRLRQLRAVRARPSLSSGADGGEAKRRPRTGGDYQAPGNPAEEILAGIWGELLGIDQIGVRDDFFHLGGHSLMGLQLISRIRDTFAVEIPLAALFEAPTIAVLAELIDEAILMELDEMSDEEALGLIGGAAA